MARVVGETGEQTLNVVQADGRTTHVRCGADILLSGLHQDVRGEATCPVCGVKTAVAVQGGRVASVVPESALLHFVVEDQPRFSICCSDTFVFDRRDCLDRWLRAHGTDRGRVSSLPDFMSEAHSRRGTAPRRG